MNCKQAHDHLLDLAQGAEAQGEVAEHLRACAACAQQVEQLRGTMALLDGWPEPEPSPYFDARLAARLREETQQQAAKSWLGWFRKPALATVFLVLFAVGALLYRGGLPISRPAPQPVTIAHNTSQPSAVKDLQDLDRYQAVYTDDLLDDLVSEEQQTVRQ